MGKKTKNQLKDDNSLDLTMRLLEDLRINGKDIELYNLAVKDFPNAKIHDPISVLEFKIDALDSYNNYIKKTLETPGLTEEQIKKCLLNSYVRYYTHMLGFN